MSDTELARHEAMWHGFTRLMKWTAIVVALLLVFLDLLLVKQW